MDEPIYTVREVAKILSLSENFVIELFAGQPDVMDFGQKENYMKHKRRRRALRIPASALARVMREKGKQ